MDIVGLLRDSQTCAARNRFAAADEIDQLRTYLSIARLNGAFDDHPDCGAVDDLLKNTVPTGEPQSYTNWKAKGFPGFDRPEDKDDAK